MHKVDGLELEFTSRRSWRVDVYRDGKKIGNIPVAWMDSVVFDKVAGRPTELLVWHTSEEVAKEWVKERSSVVVIAESRNPPKEQPREFKQFNRLCRVEPIATGDACNPVRAKFIEWVKAGNFES